ncbi:MAG: RDD family protein [Ehrlichia sp.]
MFLYKYLPFLKKNGQNQTQNGICYSGGVRRFSSILIDLIILIFILQIIHNVYSYFVIYKQEDSVMIKIIEKYKMNVSLTQQETHLKNIYIYKVILGQVIQMIVLYVYVTYSWVKFSATPGKFITGLRVVNATNFQKNNTISINKACFCSFSFLYSVMSRNIMV